MAEAVYGPGGTGWYVNPTTGQREWQVRDTYGPNAYDPNVASTYGTPAAAYDSGAYQSGGAANVGGLTSEQQSAKAIIRGTLAEYGLEGLSEKAWQSYLSGAPMEQVMLEIRESPEYKQRFAGMAALQKKGRAISEGEYIAIEKQYVSLFRQSGLPEGFYDSPDDFAAYIGNEVSPQEMAGRLDLARKAVYETAPEVRDQLSRLYNLGAGDVMAFLLDANKALPLLEQQFVAAEAAAASKLSGFGMLTRGEAEQVGLYGRSFDQLAEGFDKLAESGELFNPLIGEQGDSITRDEQLGAAFGGNTAAARRIQKRARERVARFQGGGGFAETQGGITGLGSADA